MSRLRRAADRCSSTVSDPVNMRIHGAQSASMRKEKSSVVLLFGAVAGLWSASGYPREKGRFTRGWKTVGVYPLVPLPGRQDSARFSSDPLPMSTIIKIDKTLQKGYTNLTRGYGGIGRRARFRFWCPRRAGSSPVTRTIMLENCLIQGFSGILTNKLIPLRKNSTAGFLLFRDFCAAKAIHWFRNRS